MGADIFVALAALAWLAERIRQRALPRLRLLHLASALWIAARLLSLAFAEAKGTGARNVLLIVELAVLGVLTSEFASDRRTLQAIILVIGGVSLATALLAAVGLILFYSGDFNSLLGVLRRASQAIGRVCPRARRVCEPTATRQLLHLRLRSRRT